MARSKKCECKLKKCLHLVSKYLNPFPYKALDFEEHKKKSTKYLIAVFKVLVYAIIISSFLVNILTIIRQVKIKVEVSFIEKNNYYNETTIVLSISWVFTVYLLGFAICEIVKVVKQKKGHEYKALKDILYAEEANSLVKENKNEIEEPIINKGNSNGESEEENRNEESIDSIVSPDKDFIREVGGKLESEVKRISIFNQYMYPIWIYIAFFFQLISIVLGIIILSDFYGNIVLKTNSCGVISYNDLYFNHYAENDHAPYGPIVTPVAKTETEELKGYNIYWHTSTLEKTALCFSVNGFEENTDIKKPEYQYAAISSGDLRDTLIAKITGSNSAEVCKTADSIISYISKELKINDYEHTFETTHHAIHISNINVNENFGKISIYYTIPDSRRLLLEDDKYNIFNCTYKIRKQTNNLMVEDYAWTSRYRKRDFIYFIRKLTFDKNTEFILTSDLHIAKNKDIDYIVNLRDKINTTSAIKAILISGDIMNAGLDNFTNFGVALNPYSLGTATSRIFFIYVIGNHERMSDTNSALNIPNKFTKEHGHAISIKQIMQGNYEVADRLLIADHTAEHTNTKNIEEKAQDVSIHQTIILNFENKFFYDIFMFDPFFGSRLAFTQYLNKIMPSEIDWLRNEVQQSVTKSLIKDNRFRVLLTHFQTHSMGHFGSIEKFDKNIVTALKEIYNKENKNNNLNILHMQYSGHDHLFTAYLDCFNIYENNETIYGKTLSLVAATASPPNKMNSKTKYGNRAWKSKVLDGDTTLLINESEEVQNTYHGKKHTHSELTSCYTIMKVDKNEENQNKLSVKTHNVFNQEKTLFQYTWDLKNF